MSISGVTDEKIPLHCRSAGRVGKAAAAVRTLGKERSDVPTADVP